MTDDTMRSKSETETYGKYVNELSKRYENRGIFSCVRSQAEAQKKAESMTNEIAPVAYDPAYGEATPQKHGEFLSSVDYVDYYSSHRSANAASNAALDDDDADVNVKVLRKRENCETDDDDCKTTVFNLVKATSANALKKAGEMATEWFPIESRQNRLRGSKKKFPIAAIATILMMSLSLMLIVGSAVMVSSASTELYALQREADELKETEKELNEKLEFKNDLKEIESIAKDDLGMVSGDYVDIKYMSLGGEDVIEAYDQKSDGNVNFSTLLSGIASIFK